MLKSVKITLRAHLLQKNAPKWYFFTNLFALNRQKNVMVIFHKFVRTDKASECTEMYEPIKELGAREKRGIVVSTGPRNGFPGKKSFRQKKMFRRCLFEGILSYC
jgi:hypothetical protein